MTESQEKLIYKLQKNYKELEDKTTLFLIARELEIAYGCGILEGGECGFQAGNLAAKLDIENKHSESGL